MRRLNPSAPHYAPGSEDYEHERAAQEQLDAAEGDNAMDLEELRREDTMRALIEELEVLREFYNC